jgi:hypothetical protein
MDKESAVSVITVSVLSAAIIVGQQLVSGVWAGVVVGVGVALAYAAGRLTSMLED